MPKLCFAGAFTGFIEKFVFANGTASFSDFLAFLEQDGDQLRNEKKNEVMQFNY